MSTGSVIRKRLRRRWLAALMAAVVISSVTSAVYAIPSSFVELDGNIVDDSATNPPYDWGSLFTGGVFNGQNTPPTAPTLAVSDATIAAAAFQVDPLSADVTECGTGDPSVFTGQGSEKNGGDLNVFTINTASVPGKDDISNVYAVAHITTGVNEVFFGAERIINNGDSHIDFEFLQSPLTVPAGCGVRTLSGHRSMGDLLLVVDFTRGGTLGGTQLYEWHCLAENQTQPADGTICDPTGAKPAAHYQQTTNSAVAFLVNGATDIACGDWACRSDNGSEQEVVNTNEFMEGGINLAELGFTGCFSTLLPHTRSSQSFTATLKDLEVINFNTCKTPAITTQVKKVSDNSNVTPSTPIATGVAVYDTATLTNATADAGGTVTYKLYTNDTCTTPSTSPQLGAVAADGVTVTVTNGVVPASNTVANGSVSFSTGGTWYFQATYSGDARNVVPAGGLKSACTSEAVVVKNNPAPHSTPVVQIKDTLTVTGFTSNATGNVVVGLYTSATCTTGQQGTDTSFPVSGAVNGTLTAETSFVTVLAGTYYYKISYAGDTSNTAFSSCAEIVGVTITSLQ